MMYLVETRDEIAKGSESNILPVRAVRKRVRAVLRAKTALGLGGPAGSIAP